MVNQRPLDTGLTAFLGLFFINKRPVSRETYCTYANIFHFRHLFKHFCSLMQYLLYVFVDTGRTEIGICSHACKAQEGPPDGNRQAVFGHKTPIHDLK